MKASPRDLNKGRLGAVACLLLITLPAFAQTGGPYDLTWSTVDAGGAAFVTGSNYVLRGTAGQPDAGGALSSGGLTLMGGFWPGSLSLDTPTPTGTPTGTATTPPTGTATQTPTSSQTRTFTATGTASATTTATSAPTAAPTNTATPTTTASSAPTAPPTSTATATTAPTGTATQSPTATEAPDLVVNTTSDTNDGTCGAAHCSLREAITAANSNIGPDIIAFNIPGGDPGCDDVGVCVIRPASQLPWLTDDGTTIDGYTQPGASSGTSRVLKIVLDGYDNNSFSGLPINSANNVIRGLVVQRFTPFTGIDIFGVGARDNRVEGNFIGTDVTGTQPRGNCTPPTSCAAVWLRAGATDNTIGPDNLIAHNGQGVRVSDTPTLRNTITRNRIQSNAGKGILLDGGNGFVGSPSITVISQTEASGTACANCTIEVFSDEGDEGAIYEGTVTADASGNWVFIKALGLAGPKVTTTATNSLGNTSEFSTAMTLPEPTFTPTTTQTFTRTATVTPSTTPTGTVPPLPTSTATDVATPTPTGTQISTATLTLTTTAAPTGTPTPTTTPLLACVGDCGQDGAVTVDELVKGVNIALGTLPLADCEAFDSTGDQRVTVDELVQGVNNALSGCS